MIETLLTDLLSKHNRANARYSVGLGIAKDVTESDCTVIREGRPDLTDVAFYAGDKLPGSHKVEKPKEGSPVLYAIFDGQQTEAVVILSSEIEKHTIVIGSIKQVVDKDGIELSRGSDTLGKVLSDLMQELQNVIVVQGTSPNIPAIENIKQRMKKILK